MKTTDLRIEEMRDFHPSEGNTFSDHALRCAVDGKVLLTKAQAEAVEDHLNCVASSLDARLWGYGGSYYEIDCGHISEDEQSWWLVRSPFDPYLPAPDGSEDPLHGAMYDPDDDPDFDRKLAEEREQEWQDPAHHGSLR